MKAHGDLYHLFLLLCFVLILSIWFPVDNAAAASNPVRVTLGEAVVPLNGPWRFHTGDDPRWADPNFDDSSWETVDLTPAVGAHDSDVGLTGYVPGWGTRGHAGYSGYAWYRIRISVFVPQGKALALCAPYYVDGDYQVFVNGKLLGGTGDFSKQPPVVYNIHIPKFFPLPQSLVSVPSDNQSSLIAVRVWTPPVLLGTPDAGGIHIAPAFGTTQGAESLYHAQWSQMIEGYIVDASEGVLFLVLAVMVCTLILFDRSDAAYFWLFTALVLIACARGNQAVFFWWQFESIHGFELTTIVTFVPLSIAAWTLAWCYWFRLSEGVWISKLVGVLATLFVVSEFLRRSWFYGVFPHWFNSAAFFCITSVRWLFLLLTLFIIFRVMSRQDREKWFALTALLLVSVGLFTPELVKLHIPGIWFPFGVGVSLSEFAYAIFDVAMFLLLLHRLYSFRLQQQPAIARST